MAEPETTTHRVLNSLMWSFAQNWGNRALTFLLFLVLARILTPAEVGLASTVALVLLVLSLLAEFGYGQAIVQRQALERADTVLPFATSLALACAFAVALVLAADRVEALLAAPGLAALLPVAALTLPLTTLSAFQEAFYRRAFDYRALALRMLTATAISGGVGLGAAWWGLGALSLILQALTLNLVSVVWLWARPRWLPLAAANPASWRAMTGFSIHVVSSRLLEFVTGRLIDLIIVMLHGVVGLGLYTVGARVYQTLMQVLTSAVTDVSMSALSRIATDAERLRSAYLKSIALSSLVCSPVFVCAAALSPEIVQALFGPKWGGSEGVMAPLMLLGAVQTIQFINGSYFSALGRPSYVLALNVVKAVILLPGLLLISTGTVQGLTFVFVCGQALITPLTFHLIVRLLKLRWVEVLAQCRGLALALAAALATVYTRPHLGAFMDAPLARLLALGALFGGVYLCLCLCFARGQVAAMVNLGLGGFRRPQPALERA